MGGSADVLAPNLEVACRHWADRPAITFGGTTTSYQCLWERVKRLAGAYRELGVKPGDRIVCQFRNCPEHVIAINAAWACGAVHVGTDNDLTGAELSWIVAHTAASVVLFQPPVGPSDPMAAIRAVRSACPATTIVHHGPTATDRDDLSLDELLSSPRDGYRFDARWPGGDETGLLLLTSGTTGKPKAVMETLRGCWAKMQFFADAMAPGPDDVHLLFLPMAHVFGLRLSQIALLSGGRLVLLDRFSPAGAVRLVSQERVTILPGMPSHFTMMLPAVDPTCHDVSCLRWAVTAAASLPRELALGVYQDLGAAILYVYGCSENFTTLTTDPHEILAGSVGTTVFRAPEPEPPDGSVRVVGPDDHVPLPAGASGEIAFGARRPVHYWGAPDAAVDGWYYTGDLGRIDADGRIYVLGRLKELVNRGGLKVSPSEIETAASRHRALADAAVVAMPDPVLGEAICLCVVPAGDDRPRLADLRSFLAETLARHKLPDELAVVDSVPRTKFGKVDRRSLVEAIAAAGTPVERLRPR